MNLSEIKMETWDARRAFIDYRKAVRQRQYQQVADLEAVIQREDALILKTYRTLSLGRRIIMLSETMRAAGVDDMGRPKLAVARADQKSVHLAVEGGVWRICGADSMIENRYHATHAKSYCFPAGPAPDNLKWKHFNAVVPLIPAPLRPDANLERYHILWEAEWRRVAPRDPALLKHMGGDMYAVVAVWDLTEVERMALGIRLAGMAQ